MLSLMTTLALRLHKRLPRINLQDLGPEDPEIIPTRVPHGIKLNGFDYLFKTKPFAHQMAALRRLWLMNSGALLMEQGTGKTGVVTHFIGLHYLDGKKKQPQSFDKVLIVCPLSTMGVWVSELRKHLPKSVAAETVVYRLVGNRNQRISKIKAAINCKGLKILLINYESSWRLEEWLHLFSADILISDESHRIKSPRAKQSKALWRLGHKAKRCVIMTGTPVVSGPHDIWSQWNFLDPHVFGDNWYRFQSHYVIKGGYFQKEIVGFRDIATLKSKIRRSSFIITKSECLDLPEKIFQRVPVELSQNSKNIYNEMATQLVVEIEEGKVSTASIVLVKLLRLAQITGGFLKDIDGDIHDIGSEKLDTCLELIDDRVGDGHKIVIFCRFRHDISRLSQALVARDIKHVCLTGSVKSHDRDAIITQFQSQRRGSPVVFISQIAAGSLGITLTAANTAIFYSLDFSLANYLQAADRLHRIGQTQKVTYLHLIVSHSIDQVVYEILKRKEDVAKFILAKPRAILID